MPHPPHQSIDLFAGCGGLSTGLHLAGWKGLFAVERDPAAFSTLTDAPAAGPHVYVTIAPTYPECGAYHLMATLRSIRPLDPLTIFHEPINIRADNIRRIADHARRIGIRLRTDVFATPESWQDYAIHPLLTMKQAARKAGLAKQLHPWLDKSLGAAAVVARQQNPDAYAEMLREAWGRVSNWRL